MTFKFGDLVRLKTGGPSMVVGDVHKNDVDVYYVTSTYEVRAVSLPECVLEPILDRPDKIAWIGRDELHMRSVG